MLACKKDKPPTLSGMWNQDSVQFKSYSNGIPGSLGTDREKGLVWNFQNNGKLLILGPSLRMELPYQMIGDNKVVIEIVPGIAPRDIFWISDSKVIIHHFDSIQPPITEYWIYLSR